MSFNTDRCLLTSITLDNCRCLWSTVIDYYRPGCITVDYYRLLWSIMDRYRLLLIIIVPRCVSHHANYVRRFYTGGGDGGDGYQRCVQHR